MPRTIEVLETKPCHALSNIWNSSNSLARTKLTSMSTASAFLEVNSAASSDVQHMILVIGLEIEKRRILWALLASILTSVVIGIVAGSITRSLQNGAAVGGAMSAVVAVVVVALHWLLG